MLWVVLKTHVHKRYFCLTDLASFSILENVCFAFFRGYCYKRMLFVIKNVRFALFCGYCYKRMFFVIKNVRFALFCG
jgi:hypothetical protein